MVDDEPNILSSLRRLLAAVPVDHFDGEKPELTISTDPNEALQLFDDHRFDLVISDLRMPIMDGVTMLSAMAERQPQVARILMSGYADLDAIIGAVNDAQVFRFIPKPWHEREVKLAVTQALQMRTLLLENERLANMVRSQKGVMTKQEAELRRLEAEHPGITRIKRDETGAILIDDDDL
jgi:DNA-binding NtrC family response regulator